MTNTERLIATLEHAVKYGHDSVTFMVGKYTGNGSSVVPALVRRGYRVDRVPSNGSSTYRLFQRNL